MKDTRSVYKIIQEDAPNDLQESIKVILSGAHCGAHNAITKARLSQKIFGKYTSTTDRQIRDAVADLQEQGELIVSNSGDGGGYYYAMTDSEAKAYLDEIQSRIDKLASKRDSLYQTYNKVFYKKDSPLQRTLF